MKGRWTVAMTFEEFRASGRDCGDLGAVLKDECLKGAKGRIYCGALFIEDTSGWPKDCRGFGKGKWYTLIGREEPQSDSLEVIERELFAFAVGEEYEVPPSAPCPCPSCGEDQFDRLAWDEDAENVICCSCDSIYCPNGPGAMK